MEDGVGVVIKGQQEGALLSVGRAGVLTVVVLVTKSTHVIEMHKQRAHARTHKGALVKRAKSGRVLWIVPMSVCWHC